MKITAKAIDVRESIVSTHLRCAGRRLLARRRMEPGAIEVIRKSLKDLGILDSLPDARTIYNDQFVPVKL